MFKKILLLRSSINVVMIDLDILLIGLFTWR